MGLEREAAYFPGAICGGADAVCSGCVICLMCTLHHVVFLTHSSGSTNR